MKKIISILLILLFFISCATQEKYNICREQKNLMTLKNTDMHRIQKYSQKSYQKHIKQNRIKNH